jgi:hypothetical protein
MRFFKGLLLGMVAWLGSTAVSSAQTSCSQCGRVHVTAASHSSGFQSQAESEARAMAARRFKGHIQGTQPGVNFCGVGWSSHSTPSTCTPSRPMTLVADAIVRGADGFYRVRYWR